MKPINISSKEDISVFFQNSLSKFVSDKGIQGYLHQVLMNHFVLNGIQEDNLRRSGPGSRTDSIEDLCTIRRIRAQTQNKESAYINLKGLGDMLLFTSGFFPEHAASTSVYGKRSVDLQFYIKQGIGTYGDLHSVVSSTDFPLILMISKGADHSWLGNSDFFNYLSNFFVEAAKALYSTRLDFAENMFCIDHKLNEEIYAATGHEGARDSNPRKVYLPKKCSSQGPVIEIGGHIYSLKDIYSPKPGVPILPVGKK